MVQDKAVIFDDKRTLTTLAVGNAIATTGSTQCYDTSPPGVPNPIGPAGGAIGGPLLHDIGRGVRLRLFVQVTTTATSGGAATLVVAFVCADVTTTNPDTCDLSVNTTILLLSDVIPLATLVQGYRFRFSSTPGVVPRRFVGIQYTVATAVFTAGNISAMLQMDADDHHDTLG